MGFMTGLINDAEKQVNPAHVIALLLTTAVIVWGFIKVLHTHAVPSNLSGCAELLGGAGAVNVAHKAEDIIAKFKKADVPEGK